MVGRRTVLVDVDTLESRLAQRRPNRRRHGAASCLLAGQHDDLPRAVHQPPSAVGIAFEIVVANAVVAVPPPAKRVQVCRARACRARSDHSIPLRRMGRRRDPPLLLAPRRTPKSRGNRPLLLRAHCRLPRVAPDCSVWGGYHVTGGGTRARPGVLGSISCRGWHEIARPCGLSSKYTEPAEIWLRSRCPIALARSLVQRITSAG